ncbi:hypothetical protein HZS_6788 [Henneguya salminicola]|nr:hypothetical protein HZS_6788 [Henneguya salminicola]
MNIFNSNQNSIKKSNKIGYLRGPFTEALLIIEIQPHNSTIAGRLFLQHSWVGNIDGEFQRFFLWSSDEGLAIFQMGSELFIDATPHTFVQCLIVMSFAPSINLFAPCVWTLMSRRNEYLYCELLHAIIVQLKCVVFYFEKALLNSVKYPFSRSIEDDQINEKLQEIQSLKGLTYPNWLNLGNISVEYGLRNIRLVYGKTNDKQKTSTRAQTIV